MGQIGHSLSMSPGGILTAMVRRPRTKRDAVLRVARAQPRLGFAKVAEAAGCSPATARRHLLTAGRAARTRVGSGVLDLDYTDRLAKARGGATTATLAWLATDPNPRIREAVCCNHRCPPRARTRFAADPSDMVRSLHAGRVTNLVKLRRLAADPAAVVRRGVVANLHTPAGVLRRLSTEQHLIIRRCVASHTATPVEVLERLTTDPEPAVRIAAAENANTPTDAAVLLAEDENVEVLWRIAERADMPAHVLQRLAGMPHDGVRASVATNPSCPEAALVVLARHRNRDVRCAALRHPDTPTAVVEELTAHTDPHTRVMAAIHPNCPAAAAEQVISHDTEARETLEHLTRDIRTQFQHAETPALEASPVV